MKKIKDITIFLLSLVFIYMGISYTYSNTSFEQRTREVKAMTEAELTECIEEKFRKMPPRWVGDMVMSSTATDREIMEAQCLHKDYFVHRIPNIEYGE